MERKNKKAYNDVNSLHPEIDIEEQGLIYRLDFEQKIELVNDDDTELNLNISLKNKFL